MRSVRVLTAALALTGLALTAAPSQAGAPAPVLVDTIAGFQPTNVANLGNITVLSRPSPTVPNTFVASFELLNLSGSTQTYTLSRLSTGSATITPASFNLANSARQTVTMTTTTPIAPAGLAKYQVARAGIPNAAVNVVEYATP